MTLEEVKSLKKGDRIQYSYPTAPAPRRVLGTVVEPASDVCISVVWDGQLTAALHSIDPYYTRWWGQIIKLTTNPTTTLWAGWDANA